MSGAREKRKKGKNFFLPLKSQLQFSSTAVELTDGCFLSLFSLVISTTSSRSKPWLSASTSGLRRPKVRVRIRKGGERGARRGRPALESVCFFFFLRRIFLHHLNAIPPPHVKSFFPAGLHTRVPLDCSSLGLNGSPILYPHRRKTYKRAHWRNWRRERGRDRLLVFIFFFLSSQGKKKALRATKKGKSA